VTSSSSTDQVVLARLCHREVLVGLHGHVDGDVLDGFGGVGYEDDVELDNMA
jgi:hypothetical protein